ncbi:hypothetical protein D9V37_04200 [Nocardioides mangrovicus]|uniref:DUF4352 domain-containing protein n=1 Tax=Nocardioides mangrovicus TaxID=2478913 RepID=A0A3L8P810_9ACTN|nr:hypothetical protein [Nocardioides mangrovicus]RLV51127.1 hypothetical protein D9V37_04200 [Nocardioides mangrovicus]
MSDSGAGEAASTAAAEGRPKLRHRARGFVKNRSNKQKVTGVAAVALLITAPFGGLKAEPAPKPATLHLNRAYDIGPFDVTVQKVVTVSSLSPVIKPARKHDRLLVVEALVHNRTDEPQYSSYISKAIVTKNMGARPGVADAYLVKDASSLSEQVNPGLTYRLAFVFQQARGWEPASGDDAPRLGLGRWTFQADDPLTLDPDAWVPERLLVEAPVDVKVKP